MAIDLTVLAECLPRKWGFLLSGLACLWGLGSTITGLIGIANLLLHWPSVSTNKDSLAACGKLLLPTGRQTSHMH